MVRVRVRVRVRVGVTLTLTLTLTQVWEGGIKVPMLAYWPGSIAPGGKIDEVVSTLDLTATMAHAAGIDDRPETLFHGVRSP